MSSPSGKNVETGEDSSFTCNEPLATRPNLWAGGVAFSLPERTRALLWTKDSIAPPAKAVDETGTSVRSDPTYGFRACFRFDGEFSVTEVDTSASTAVITDPSIVYLREPVVRPANEDRVPHPQGLSYVGLTPEQRWVYLSWLQDLAQPISGEYLTLYYWDLERQLIAGDFKAAVAELWYLREQYLRECHPYGYGLFQLKSFDSLLTACMVHNDSKAATELISGNQCFSQLEDITLLAASRLHIGLSASVLMNWVRSWSREVNMRYIRAYPDLYRQELTHVLWARYGQDSLPLPEVQELIILPSGRPLRLLSNPCFPHEERSAHPWTLNFVKDDKLLSETLVLLRETHAAVKSKFAAERRALQSSGYTASSPADSDLAMAYRCPTCGANLGRGPALSTKCPKCHARIVVRHDDQTNRRVLLTAEQAQLRENIRKQVHGALKKEEDNVCLIKRVADYLNLSEAHLEKLRIDEGTSQGRAATYCDILLPRLAEEAKKAVCDRSLVRWELCYFYAGQVLKLEKRKREFWDCNIAARLLVHVIEQCKPPQTDSGGFLPLPTTTDVWQALADRRWLLSLARNSGLAGLDVPKGRLSYVIQCLIDRRLPVSLVGSGSDKRYETRIQ